MRTPFALPAELRDRSFNTRDAAAHGIGGERLRRRDLDRPFRGVRTLHPTVTLAERARAYAPRLTDKGFISHTSAAALWGMPLPLTIDGRVHVSHPHRHRAVRTVGVVGHHLVIRAEEITEIDGFPVTTPERTWCDLAGLVGLEALVAAGDRLLWHRAPLTTPERVRDMAARHPGRRGRVDRMHALALLSDRADSPPESILRTRIVLQRAPDPSRQRPAPWPEWRLDRPTRPSVHRIPRGARVRGRWSSHRSRPVVEGPRAGAPLRRLRLARHAGRQRRSRLGVPTDPRGSRPASPRQGVERGTPLVKRQLLSKCAARKRRKLTPQEAGRLSRRDRRSAGRRRRSGNRGRRSPRHPRGLRARGRSGRARRRRG